MKRKAVINIGDTDENADWIKTPENIAREREIYERLKRAIKSIKARDAKKGKREK